MVISWISDWISLIIRSVCVIVFKQQIRLLLGFSHSFFFYYQPMWMEYLPEPCTHCSDICSNNLPKVQLFPLLSSSSSSLLPTITTGSDLDILPTCEFNALYLKKCIQSAGVQSCHPDETKFKHWKRNDKGDPKIEEVIYLWSVGRGENTVGVWVCICW